MWEQALKKFLKKFNESVNDNYSDISKNSIYNPSLSKKNNKSDKNLIYNKEWESLLPETLTINYHNKLYKFKKDNIMLLDDLVQITYDSYSGEIWGSPDTLEFDIYFVMNDNDGKMRINIDITYGDLMACEFAIEAPNKVDLVQDTTYHSKFDPSNTVFALDDKSLDNFIVFLNKFPGIQLTRYDIRFLDQLDDYIEN